MTDVARSSVPVQQEALQFNQPVSEASVSSIGGVANYLLGILCPIGTIIASMCTQSEINQQLPSWATSTGPGTWVLANGQDVTGSQYQFITGNTTVPDLRGIYIRGKNNGRSDGNQNPAGDLALGTFENDQMQGHWHHARGQAVDVQNGTGATIDIYNKDNTVNYNADDRVTTAVTDGVNGTPRLGAETRVKDVTINYFIRVN